MKCDKKVIRGDGMSGLCCGTCSGLFHAECEGMCQKDLESFLSLSPAQQKAWNCKECNGRRKSVLRATQADPSLHPLFGRFDALEERFERVEGHVSSLERIESLISKMFDQFSDLKNDVHGLRQEVKHMRDDVYDLQDENVEMKRRIAKVEENSSMEPACDFRALELHGTPPLVEKDLYAAAQRVLREALSIAVEERDLDDCFFVGGRPIVEDGGEGRKSDGGGSRQRTGILVVRFTTRRMRDEIFRIWRGRRDKVNGIMIDGKVMDRFRIAERLNRSTRELLRETRSVAKQRGWRYVWTSGGRILVRRENTEKVFIIRSFADLKIIT